MTCYHPLTAFRGRNKSIVFNKTKSINQQPIQLPCGQCIGCRLERSRQWAVRCMHEASLYEKNCFITLTYADEHLPENGSLQLDHFQKFMKRLRKKFGQNIRFYHCGEYGEKFRRPHYHACLFNFDFADKQIFKKSLGNQLYTSEVLSKLWPFGWAVIGNVTFESAAYVARYIMKKVNGPNAYQHYEHISDYGEVVQLHPEYTTMSRRPGIGANWFKKWQNDVYPSDFIVVNKMKVKPPKYYDRQYEFLNPEDLKKIKRKRVKLAKKHLTNNTTERLLVREQLTKLKISKLVRNL